MHSKKLLYLYVRVALKDGIHQVQLIVPTTPSDPVTEPGFKLHSCQSLNGEKKATVTFELTETSVELTETSVKEIQLWMMDSHGNIVYRKFDLSKDPTQPPENP